MKEGNEESDNAGTTGSSASVVHEGNDDNAKEACEDTVHSHHSHNNDDSTSSSSYEYDSTKRDAFFAFVPQIARFGCDIASHEVTTVKNAVVGFPSWSQDYFTSVYTFYHQNPKILYKEVISGFTVAIMQVPESIAFSFVAGVPPLSGLHATFWMALITGLFGGKPGMISGAAGALAVVVADMTSQDGVLWYLAPAERLNVLYMTMFVCGIFQILFAVFRLAKLVRLIPETGMIGFMNGLAIIIFMAQLPAFQYCTEEPLFIECTLEQRKWLTFQDNTWQLILTLVHVFICMAIMNFFPKIPKIGKIIPASLMGLLIGTLIEHTLFRMVFRVGTRTVSETAPMSGSPPIFDWPRIPNDSETIRQMFVFAITLAAIGSVESVLTLQACNEITDTVPKISDSNQELFAQGLGNLVSGLFRAMGGDAMIGQSTINIMNGARHRVSSTMSGIFMLLFVVALAPFIELLPVATLTGVLFMVVLSTFQWKTFMILRYGRLSDSIAIVLVTLIAVFFNLAVAIGIGIVFSALIHAWDSGSHVDADIELKAMLINGEECEVKYVHVRGAIFFSSTRKFVNMFSVSDDPLTVVLDLKDALIIDHSAVAAVQGLSHRFAQKGKRVLLTNLPHKSYRRLHRTGNHRMLKEQITCASKIETIDEENQLEKQAETTEAAADTAAKEKGKGEAAMESSPRQDRPAAQPAATGLTRVHEQEFLDCVDEFRVGETLSRLAMFQNPVDPVETEIRLLGKDQGDFSIHSLKKYS